jgi:hypothetical protein
MLPHRARDRWRGLATCIADALTYSPAPAVERRRPQLARRLVNSHEAHARTVENECGRHLRCDGIERLAPPALADNRECDNWLDLASSRTRCKRTLSEARATVPLLCSAAMLSFGVHVVWSSLPRPSPLPPRVHVGRCPDAHGRTVNEFRHAHACPVSSRSRS